MKFCDFYSFEYAEIKNHTDVPLLKIESDYTIQSSGQLLTRLEAFAESIQPETLEQTIDGDTKGERKMGKGYFAGIDSGSTSTDVVILNKDHEIVTSIILPTGAGAAIGADRALAEALKEAGLQREELMRWLLLDTDVQLLKMVIRVSQRSPVMQEVRIS